MNEDVPSDLDELEYYKNIGLSLTLGMAVKGNVDNLMVSGGDSGTKLLKKQWDKLQLK